MSNNEAAMGDLQQDALTSLLDWEALRQRSLLPGGFGADRSRIWPVLLGVDRNEASEVQIQVDSSFEHADERQIRLDTDRSFVLYPDDSSSMPREELQSELHELLIKIFRKRRKLSYFQGYHDIITVLLLTLPAELHLSCSEKLSLHRVRDSMGLGLEPVIGLLNALNNLLRLIDPSFAKLLESTIPLPYYALSNLLTLFAHDVPTLALIQHIFDYILCRPPIIIIYLAAALVLTRRSEIERLEKEGEEGMMHSLLSSLPTIVDEEVNVHKEEPSQSPPPPYTPSADTAAHLDLDFVDAHVNSGDKGQDISREHTAVNTSQNLLISNGALSPANDVVASQKVKTEECEESLADSRELSTSAKAEISAQMEETLADPAMIELSTRTIVGENSQAQESLVDDLTAQELSTPVKVEEAAEVDETVQPSSNALFMHNPQSDVLGKLDPSEEDEDSSPLAFPRLSISLSSVLRQADSLYASYPPSHPSLELSSIMGPQSVVFTWSENFSKLPEDEEAEAMVQHPELTVRPYPPPKPPQTKESVEGKKTAKRARTDLLQRRTVIVSAVVVVGVAIAVYSARSPACSRIASDFRGKDWRHIGKWATGVVLCMYRLSRTHAVVLDN